MVLQIALRTRLKCRQLFLSLICLMPNVHISTLEKSVLTSHIARLHKMTQKSVSLKHFGSNFDANTELPKSVSKLYHNLVGCALNMEDLPSNSPF